jgi:A/G-specific adenine glycosylase
LQGWDQHNLPISTAKFRQLIWDFYNANKRDFPWRRTSNPYRILVSEVMLQQTQTARVETKYKSFITKFPNLKKLAAASLSEVLGEWKGLGYNRRGLALHRIARALVREKRSVPKTAEELVALPGIGPNTAASILAFAHNLPTIFIETNIRTVFTHHFFSKQAKVNDKEILKLVEKTLDKNNPREWYYALMDYGVYLKKQHGSINAKSVHYRKQSKFVGSNRQQRAELLELIRQAPRAVSELEQVSGNKGWVRQNVAALVREGFVVRKLTARGVKFIMKS